MPVRVGGFENVKVSLKGALRVKERKEQREDDERGGASKPG